MNDVGETVYCIRSQKKVQIVIVSIGIYLYFCQLVFFYNDSGYKYFET